ncbi:hypothetical protein [Thiorhodococcus minor]|uniref:Uncharacterized protein n=1 Tax=Thiorhodococcus minor TaxID=57489 RepID=A0A6M0K2X9_9GAMM|nr:hypothetical protein [Thiorhodococcus minor]NEV64128.1 hypothetical protein [Thiorhodococcus minor]
MSSLDTRLKKLERQLRPGTTLVVMTAPGETIDQATERTCQAWGRPAESFRILIGLNLHGRPGV